MKHKHIYLFLCLFAMLAFALNGCSSSSDDGGQYWGGGGGVAPTPTPGTPSISGVTPAESHLGDRVTVTGTNFGAAQGNGYVTVNGIEVRDGLEKAVTKEVRTIDTWSDTQIVFTFPPGVPSGPITIIVYTDTGATAVYGAGSGTPGQEITAVEARWQKTLVQLGNRSGFSEDSENDECGLAVLSNGNVVAIHKDYFDFENDYDAIFANVWNGTSWSDPVLISDPTLTDDQDAEFPQLAADGSGHAMAVWHQYDNVANYRIYYSVYDSSTGTWSAAAALSGAFDPDSTSYYACPRVAYGSNGQAVCIWSSDPGTNELYAAVYNGSTWSVPVQVDVIANAGDAFCPQVAFVNNSTVGYFAWHEYDTGSTTYRVHTRKFDTSNSSWTVGGAISATTTEMNFAPTGQNFLFPVLAFSDTMGVCVFWSSTDSLNDGRLFAATISDPAGSGTWVTPTNAFAIDDGILPADSWSNSPEDPENIGSAAGFLSTGEAVVAWVEDPDGGDHMGASRWNGSTWSTPACLGMLSSDQFDGDIYSPAVACDPFGNAMVLALTDPTTLWDDSDTYQWYSWHYTGGQWLLPGVLDFQGQGHVDADFGYDSYEAFGGRKIVFDSAGRAYAIFNVYIDGEGEGQWYANMYY